MARIYVVRHGEAAAGYGTHRDPGLSDLGRRQAEETARELFPLGPLPIYTSPLARAQETAQALAELWNCDPVIDPAFSEVPSPLEALQERSEWLNRVMSGVWESLPSQQKQWRELMLQRALSFKVDSVIFSHFVAINMLVGAAIGAQQMVVFRPFNASVTVLDNAEEQLRVVSRGREGASRVN